MTNIFGRPSARAMLAVAMTLATAAPASAVTVAVAKKCREMALKAHPPAPTGSKQGTAEAERDFYNDCVAKNGNIPVGDNPK